MIRDQHHDMGTSTHGLYRIRHKDAGVGFYNKLTTPPAAPPASDLEPKTTPWQPVRKHASLAVLNGGVRRERPPWLKDIERLTEATDSDLADPDLDHGDKKKSKKTKKLKARKPKSGKKAEKRRELSLH